jgi:hypothetical protein
LEAYRLALVVDRIFVGGMSVLGFGFGFVDSGVVERREMDGGRQLSYIPAYYL